MTIADMSGKTVVMTGATSGLGLVAADILAARGARLVLIARDKDRAEAALARFRRHDPSAGHRAHIAELSRLSEVKRVAAEVAAAEPRIDVLVNNAGTMFGHRKTTEDGLEKTFATNHMAYFVLTLLLKDPLRASGRARVVNTASVAHTSAKLDLQDLQTARSYGPMKAYARSKLCNILFTRELARRWQPLGITANCFHPGVVKTRFGEEDGGLLRLAARLFKAFGVSPEQGAETLVFLAASPEAQQSSGAYFVKKEVAAPAPAGRDDRLAAGLWAESLRLAGWEDADHLG